MKETIKQYKRRVAAQKKGITTMTNLADLKNYDVDRLQMEDLLHLDATAQATLASAATNGVDAPEWLTTTAKRLKVDIRQRNRDVLEKRLSEVRARRAALATTEEKRAQAAAEEEKLTALLNA